MLEQSLTGNVRWLSWTVRPDQALLALHSLATCCKQLQGPGSIWALSPSLVYCLSQGREGSMETGRTVSSRFYAHRSRQSHGPGIPVSLVTDLHGRKGMFVGRSWPYQITGALVGLFIIGLLGYLLQPIDGVLYHVAPIKATISTKTAQILPVIAS